MTSFSLLVLGSLVGQVTPDEPPLAGRPGNFSHVVGSYIISTSATPDEVEVEKPVALTVRIQGSGPQKYQPQRKHLAIFPQNFDQQFFVEPLLDQDQLDPKNGTWEFVYRLRPKSTAVKFIPGLTLVYYHPGRKRYSTTAADAIALTVRPAVPSKASLPTPVGAPEEFFRLGPLDDGSWSDIQRPGTWVFVLGLALPPLLCWFYGWYLPRRGQRWRTYAGLGSQAALQALQQLKKTDHDGALIGAVLTRYFRQRLHLSVVEPTADEIVQRLRRLGGTKEIQARVRDYLRRLEASRFQPSAMAQSLPSNADATQLVHEVEREPCVHR